MDEISSRLTIYFEDPFWVGVFERTAGGKLEAARVVFGAEPTDAEVYESLLNGWGGLRYSPAVAAERRVEHGNPKRMQRDAARQLAQTGTGTKAQQALKLQQELLVAEGKSRRRERRKAGETLRFELRQQKRKEKHRGR